ncbi:MAG: hypothetical protein ACRELV_00225 [Longimicrobiales bacterium]
MSEDLETRARARLDEALSERAALDPRDSFRDALRALKDRKPAAFEAARRHFEEVVVPRVAEPDSDPIAEWVDYGVELGRQLGGGAIRAVDPTGLAREAGDGATSDPAELLFFIPDDRQMPVLMLAGPVEPSAPQAASRDLLVYRRLSL